MRILLQYAKYNDSLLKFTKLVLAGTTTNHSWKYRWLALVLFSREKSSSQTNLLAYITHMHNQIHKPIKHTVTYSIENSQLHLSSPLLNRCNSLVRDPNAARTERHQHDSKNLQTLTKRLNAGFKQIFQSGPFGQVAQRHHGDLGKIREAGTVTDLLQLKRRFGGGAACLGRLPERKHNADVNTRLSGTCYTARERRRDWKDN